MKQVAFIGLGVMGYPMAGHLSKAGYDVVVYNRTYAKAEQWCTEYQGRAERTPKEAAKGCDVVFMCVGNDQDVRSVVYGEQGVLAGLNKGAFLVDHTTASAELARELEQACQKQDIHFLDAPVSGGQAGAENGALTVMVGGAEQHVEAVRPVMEHFSKYIGWQGEVGTGQLAKMVNQICIAGVVQGLAEGMQFIEKSGLDAERVIQAISQGAAGSWQMENRWKTMSEGEYDFGFAVDWMRKDLGLALSEANNNGARLPLTALVDQFYGDVQAMGGNRWDTSSLLTRFIQRDK
ncbi:MULTISPECIES: NAD(P)-dependent oxidoreductase [Gammaproteobacteria]|uniref:NAD(P)-dependent oxidoreductase n=1 Tax=Gammaproteobacteria TaxID=1236 RepID=UPI000DD03008|nr:MULTISPECIES: NAD(P)-dependent oxidoreductase [Gammaproteobacteria]RTE87312.1 NAD(P)-dependent oxidoreductase [Aliidiomarina sp. B3213]TCZ92902.1 NAD(P)-dependent oxidoreductase [Lysobacter sp. N42]